MLSASASSVRAGDKVVVTQPIPSRVIRDGTSNTLGVRDIPRGTIGRVMDKKAGRVVVEISGLKYEHDVIELRDFDFEKYFAERL